MSNDTELKTVVPESVHDDFIVAARNNGFETKSEYLRYLISVTLYGQFPSLKSTPKGINKEWRKEGE